MSLQLLSSVKTPFNGAYRSILSAYVKPIKGLICIHTATLPNHYGTQASKKTIFVTYNFFFLNEVIIGRHLKD